MVKISSVALRALPAPRAPRTVNLALGLALGLALALLPSVPLPAQTAYTSGRVKLTLDDRKGSFLLSATGGGQPETPLFDETSYITLRVDGRSLIPSADRRFTAAITGSQDRPALAFVSDDLTIEERFTFIRTAHAPEPNGVRLEIAVTNTSQAAVNASLRCLLDTCLGETRGEARGEAAHFATDLRSIDRETIVFAAGGEEFWVSRNSRASLMGSIQNGPGAVLFAAWKRLYESPWDAGFVEGRPFSVLPYSVNDSAAAYYFEPRVIAPGETADFPLLLALEDEAGFTGFLAAAPLPPLLRAFLSDGLWAPIDALPWNEALSLLGQTLALLDSQVDERSITDQERIALESVAARLRARF